MGRACLAACAAAFLLCQTTSTALASNAPTTTWTTNGTVAATLVHGGAVYVGGSFTRVGPRSGGGVVVDDTLGLRNAAASPEVAGTVSAVVPDGSGGWYVGGSFSRIGSTAIGNLAHVLTDGSVDESFAPPAAPVFTLAVSGGVVYAGGADYVTAIDHDGIALWSTPADGAVGQLKIGGGTIYAGGSFSTIGGQNRSRLAALDATTGQVTAWNPAPSGGFPFGPNVSALTIAGGTIYVAGTFAQIGGQSRAGLAAIDNAGVATAWNPGPTGGGVNALAASGSTLYAGGSFTAIGGQSRTGIAALSLATGTATAWHPVVAGLQIGVLTATAGQVFAAGSSNAGTYLVALDATTALPSGWNPRPDNSPDVLATSGNRVYVGGAFSAINTVPRRNVAAFDLATGQATAWDPSVQDGAIGTNAPTVLALAASSSTIYLGGRFPTVGGVPRSGLAAVDDSTGSLTVWNPGATFGASDAGVSALLADGTSLYVGGQFTQLGGQSRGNIGAVDLSTGSATSWNPGATGGIVRTIIKVGSSYVVGGSFSAIGGQSRGGLAALDPSGAATAWNPGTDGHVNALLANGSTIYVGGVFTTLGGQSRASLGAVDATTGNAGSLNLAAIGEPPEIEALALAGGHLYVGGTVLLGPQQVDGLAEIDTSTNALTAFRPNQIGLVSALATAGSTVFVGGSYLSGGDDLLGGGFATFQPSAPDPAPVPFRPAALLTTFDDPFVVGSTAVCHLPGPIFWNAPTSFAYSWTRDGSAIPGATTDQHVIDAADAGHVLRCTATASNAAGSGHSTSSARRVPAAPADTTPPTITITTPASGQHFALGQVVTPVYACDDGAGSGVASCTGGTIDTGSAGTRTFTVTAADNAGNPASQRVGYVVDAPVSPPPPSVTPPPVPLAPPAPPSAPFVLKASAVHVPTVRRSAKTVVVTITGLPKGSKVSGKLSGKKALATAHGTSTGGARKLTFKLNATARMAIKRKVLKRLKVSVTVTPPEGTPSKASATVGLK